MVHKYFFNFGSWLVNLPTMVYLSDLRVNERVVSFISLVLFKFNLAVSLFGGRNFQAVYTKSLYSGQIISFVNHVEHWSDICLKHAFMPRWIASSICSKGSAL